MALSLEEAAKRIKEPINTALIDKAVKHEERIRFHSQTVISRDDASSYLSEFLLKIKSVLPKDKYERFEQVLDFPIPTNEVIDIIFSELSKIFSAQNRNISYQFSRIEYREDFQNYLEWMEFDQFWKKDCFEALRNEVNCIQVVDLPAEQTSRLPEPYVFNLPVSQIIDFDILDDGNISFIAFHDKNERVIAIDDQYYRTFHIPDGDLKNIVFIDEQSHGLGWCPARPLVTDSLNSNSNFIKLSPLTKALWALDRLLFRIISKENLEDYAAYPIYSMYDEPCGYQDALGNSCKGGYVSGIDVHGNTYSTQCPSCKDNFYLGPGSILTSRPPKMKDAPDLLKQVEVTPADTQSLDYNKLSVEERKQAIIQSCVGSTAEQMTGQAQNEKQVLSAYETKQAILISLKENFEKAHKFVIDTMAALRYDRAYLGCTVDYGNRFYLATSEQLNEKLKVAKENGASVFEIDMIKQEIYENEYRNNPEQLSRIEILKRLEPFYGVSDSQLQTLNNISPLNSLDLIVKFKFAYFISKFEDENGSITDFGILLPMSRRIEIIKQTLLNYAKSELTIQPGREQQTA